MPVKKKVRPAPSGKPSKTPAKRVLILSATSVIVTTIPPERHILAMRRGNG
jgi:hypothetical protein